MSDVDPVMAFMRLRRIVEGSTIQNAYSEDPYEPVGERLRADLKKLLDVVQIKGGEAE